MVIANVRIQGEHQNTNFWVRNYEPTEEATLDRAVKNIEEFKNDNEVIIDVEELRVEEDPITVDYKFYRVQLFNASKYALGLDIEDLEEVEEYISYDYICVSK